MNDNWRGQIDEDVKNILQTDLQVGLEREPAYSALGKEGFGLQKKKFHRQDKKKTYCTK